MRMADTGVEGRGLRKLAEEQAALRNVATLAAAGAPAAELLAAVAQGVSKVFGAPAVTVHRYAQDRTITVVASVNAPAFPVGRRYPLEGTSISATVFDTGRPARIDDYAGLPGEIAAAVRDSGFRSTLGVPIVVEGTPWGVVCVGSPEPIAFPSDAESRLADFTDLVATAIENIELRDRAERLAEEQLALRRVAMLVAEGAPAGELYAAVTHEVAEILGVAIVGLYRYGPGRSMTVLASINYPSFPVGSTWPLEGDSVTARVFDTGEAARIDDFSTLTGSIAEGARKSNVSSSAGVPVIVDGVLWGMLHASATANDPLPADVEVRLRDFTELVATAVSNREAQDDLRGLAAEQAALRRLATLVAGEPEPDEVFSAVCEEMGRLLSVDQATMGRFGTGPSEVLVAGWSADGRLGESRPTPLGGNNVATRVFETGLPARIDSYDDASGEIATLKRGWNVTALVGVPIRVRDRLWGAMYAASMSGIPLPPDTEARVANFTELVATAIANAEDRAELRTNAREHAALRRVATLVALALPPEEIFSAVAEEAGRLFDADLALLARYDEYGAAGLASWSASDELIPEGVRSALGGRNLLTRVAETRKPARLDSYVDSSGEAAEIAQRLGSQSSIGAPVVNESGLWGVLLLASKRDRTFAPGSEERLAAFTELVATAISNSQTRDDLRRLAAEQAALRRVATLVAQGVDASGIFEAVCEEAGQLVRARSVVLFSYTPDGFNVAVAAWSVREPHVPVGARFRITPDTLAGMIVETRAPARIDSWEEADSDMARLIRSRGFRSSVGAPVIVDGQLWGALAAATDTEETLPAGTEYRLGRFTELIATAISNAMTRSELIASRARIVTAGDDARRKIERNLHDGTQQRLIALALDLQRIRSALPRDQSVVHAGLEDMEADLEAVLGEVREISRGLHPPLLARGGLRPALRGLARRSPIPVEVEVDLPERPIVPIETAAYYVVAEAMTNAIKHSGASTMTIRVAADHKGSGTGHLEATIVDDGIGGAQPSFGSGLMGLADRVDALGGMLSLVSPPGKGTTISVRLPLEPPVRV